MDLRKVFLFHLLLSSILPVPGYSQSAAESAIPDEAKSVGDFPYLEGMGKDEQLKELRDRLRQIESMLLAQKDRENELLRDLNKFVITAQELDSAAEEKKQQDLLATEQWFKAEATVLNAKIATLEAALAASHERDLQMGHEMNKTIVITVSAVAGIGLLVFLVTVYLQYRLISRPVQPIYMQPPPLAIEGERSQPPVTEKKPGKTGLVESKKVEETNERFVSAIERLESRIMHMEEGLVRADGVLNPSDGAKEGDESSRKSNSREDGQVISTDENEEVSAFLAGSSDGSAELIETDEMDVAVLEEEGKRFLQKEDWETAFQHFDQLVRLESDKVDNWVNRGRALEMLKREVEAIESYDRAIRANPGLPSPFLYKAALLSRMERYEEAQKYYNEALSKVPVQKTESVAAG